MQREKQCAQLELGRVAIDLAVWIETPELPLRIADEMAQRLKSVLEHTDARRSKS
jgi:hypothetical protein